MKLKVLSIINAFLQNIINFVPINLNVRTAFRHVEVTGQPSVVELWMPTLPSLIHTQTHTHARAHTHSPHYVTQC